MVPLQNENDQILVRAVARVVESTGRPPIQEWDDRLWFCRQAFGMSEDENFQMET